MRTLLLLFLSAVMSSGAEIHFVNLSGHSVTNDDVSWVFPVGVTTLTMEPRFSSILTGHGFVVGDGESVEVVLADDGSFDGIVVDEIGQQWFYNGLLAGLGAGGFAFGLRMVRQTGRMSPEI